MTCHHDYTMAHTRKKEAAVGYAANRLAHRYGFGCESDGRRLLDDHVLYVPGPRRGVAELYADDRAPGLFDVARKVLS